MLLWPSCPSWPYDADALPFKGAFLGGVATTIGVDLWFEIEHYAHQNCGFFYHTTKSAIMYFGFALASTHRYLHMRRVVDVIEPTIRSSCSSSRICSHTNPQYRNCNVIAVRRRRADL